MKPEKIHAQIDKLIEKVQNINFVFKDENLNSDFEVMKHDAAALLEEMNDLISEESDNEEELEDN
jgi:hypothetical protein